jgi:hypothetical protein
MQTLFIPMFTDFAEATRIETNRWFDLDHVPQRLTCPGFLKAERYELVKEADAGPAEIPPMRYLNVYYLESPHALQTEAYRREVAAGTPWTARRPGSGMQGTSLRGVWVQQPFATRTARLLPWEGPRTWLVRMQNEDREDIAATLSCPGVVGAERYESVEVELPGPRSTPPPRFMTIYDLETPETVCTPMFRQHQLPTVWQGVYLQRPSPWTLRPT